MNKYLRDHYVSHGLVYLGLLAQVAMSKKPESIEAACSFGYCVALVFAALCKSAQQTPCLSE